MMIRLFDLLIKTNEKEGVFNLMKDIVLLEEEDHDELKTILELSL